MATAKNKLCTDVCLSIQSRVYQDKVNIQSKIVIHKDILDTSILFVCLFGFLVQLLGREELPTYQKK